MKYKEIKEKYRDIFFEDDVNVVMLLLQQANNDIPESTELKATRDAWFGVEPDSFVESEYDEDQDLWVKDFKAKEWRHITDVVTHTDGNGQTGSE